MLGAGTYPSIQCHATTEPCKSTMQCNRAHSCSRAHSCTHTCTVVAPEAVPLQVCIMCSTITLNSNTCGHTPLPAVSTVVCCVSPRDEPKSLNVQSCIDKAIKFIQHRQLWCCCAPHTAWTSKSSNRSISCCLGVATVLLALIRALITACWYVVVCACTHSCRLVGSMQSTFIPAAQLQYLGSSCRCLTASATVAMLATIICSNLSCCLTTETAACQGVQQHTNTLADQRKHANPKPRRQEGFSTCS
jgi:hypothetical protein